MALNSVRATEQVKSKSIRNSSNVTESGRGLLNGSQVKILKGAQSLIMQAAEEAGFAAGERRHKHLHERKIKARRHNLLKTKEEIDEIIRKVPKINRNRQLETLLKEILSHTRLTHDVILKKLNQTYKDVSFKYIALEHLKNKLEKALQMATQSNNIRLANKLAGCLHHIRLALNAILRSTNKRDILAGINVAEIAEGFELAMSLDETENLISFYRDAVLDYKTLSVAYQKLLAKYGIERFFLGIDYLLQALGSDMSSKGSSISHSNLQAIVQDIEQLRTLKYIYKGLHRSIKNIKRISLSKTHGLCHNVIKKLLIIQKRRSVDGRFLTDIASACEIYRSNQKIHLFNHVLGLIRVLPEKIFMDSKSRGQILDDLQETMDDLIFELEDETS